jgi:hypothetical protein
MKWSHVLSRLLLAAAIPAGVLLAACSADRRLPEAEACKMATTHFLAAIAENAHFNNGTNRNLVLYGCTNFASKPDSGLAQIDVSFEFDTCSGSSCSHLADRRITYHFLRTDQGWKLK